MNIQNDILHALGRSFRPSALSAARRPSHLHRCTPPLSAKSGEPDSRMLVVEPDRLLLGVLKPGQPAQGLLTIRNDSAGAIVCNTVETSCPCLRVETLPGRVERRATASLKVLFDPSHDRDFRGGLAVNLTGRDPSAQVVFRSRVDLRVQDDATAALDSARSRLAKGDHP